MALQSLTLSNLAVSFGAKVQDAYVCLSLGSQTLETSVQSTQASRLNWTEDYELCIDSSNPGNQELRIEVCSKHPARRLDPCLAKCVVPIQLGRTTSGAVRQEVCSAFVAAIVHEDVYIIRRPALVVAADDLRHARSLLSSAKLPGSTTTE